VCGDIQYIINSMCNDVLKLANCIFFIKIFLLSVVCIFITNEIQKKIRVTLYT